MTKLKRIILKKNNGNITSLLIGQMFMLILIIYCLFNYRLTMLNAVFNYIDDSVTNSLLGSALVNVEEYGKSNQLLIHNGDMYANVTTNTDKNGWTADEADILLSELNYGSDITLTYKELEPKEYIVAESRNTKTYKSGDLNLSDWDSDEYLRRSISAFMGNMSYNTSNGRYSATYDAENPIGTASALGSWAACSNNNLIIDDSILKESILGSFVVGDIEITRFDIYNIYKGNLAERHVYHSEYMKYKVNGAWQDAPDNYAEDVDWDTSDAETPEQFENLYMPHPYVLTIDEDDRDKNTPITESHYDKTKLNESYASDMANYKRDLARFKMDRAYYDSGKSKWIYTNTGTTFQGKYSNTRIPFKYYFAQGGNFDIQSTINADKINNDEKAPIVGYSVYSYKSANSPYSYTSGTTMKYNPGKITESNPIKISGGKMDGTVIENTAVYVELTFTVKTFPGFAGLMDIKDAGKQQVTVSRLIDIELNEEYN